MPIGQNRANYVNGAAGAPGHVYDADMNSLASDINNIYVMVQALQANGGKTVLDYGADPTGVNNSRSAFLAAAAAGPVVVPLGTYFYSGAGIDVPEPHIVGMGDFYTNMTLAAGSYLVDASQQMGAAWLSGIRFTGGAGVWRNRYTGSNVDGQLHIRDCFFYNYTNACISANSSDSPFYKIHNCFFQGNNGTTSMGIALPTYTDGSSITDCDFNNDYIHVAARMGQNLHISRCTFLNFGGQTPGFPRADIWLATGPSDGPLNNSGAVIRDCRFGNEGLAAGDFRVLFADEGAGTYKGDIPPVTSTASTRYVRGVSIVNPSWYTSGAAPGTPLVYSTTPNVAQCQFGPLGQYEGTDPVLKLKNATGFDPSQNLIGPVIGGIVNQNDYVNWIVAESGTLTGQCRSIAGNAGLPLPEFNGPVSDASFTNAPPDGWMAVDKMNGRLWVRVNGAWRYTALT